jgi:cytochrome o ubiquinol oxidase subunit 2
MHDMMAIDARGGMGKAGIRNVRELAYDKFGARGSLLPAPARYVAAICTLDEMPVISAARAPVSRAPLLGAGLSQPSETPPTAHVALAFPSLERRDPQL